MILFNLVALNSLFVGVLYLGGSQDAFLKQGADSLLRAALLMSDAISARLPEDTFASDPFGDGDVLDHLRLRAGSEIWLFDRTGDLLAQRSAPVATDAAQSARSETPIMDALDRMGDWLAGLSTTAAAPELSRHLDIAARDLVSLMIAQGPRMHEDGGVSRSGVLAAAPVRAGSAPVAVLVLADASGAHAALVRSERERVLRIFLIAVLISVGLSLTLASAISKPLNALATAAETGRDRSAERDDPTVGRDRMPDPTARPDEIGRLSDSLRGMVEALYQRIDSNQQFAADVTHEIKNPLTSLRCAVETMRTVTRPDQRDRLLDVIEHDIRRLDRLVSDISSASRLDSDLVQEAQASFDLLEMLRNLGQYLGAQAVSKEVAFITDFPDEPIVITGLEARLAQVFVNLISNAISFCDTGDAIRIWARRRADRVLVVVEDTGPGIPEGTLDKIFERFYSNRPDRDFGNHSGLGLAISKQIVEAHDGVIWAENIRPTDADATSDPLGARFVVGLSV